VDAADWIALYGAVVATGVAVFQVGTRFRDNPRITVTASFSYSASSEDQQSATRGTLRRLERDGIVLNEEMIISFNVVNHGRRAVQISSVYCEELQESIFRVFELTPAPLPVTLEPLSSVETSIQKEVIDMMDSVSSIGVIDALGRRHEISVSETIEIARVSWNNPTRVAWYRRRDSPDVPPVRAFQLRDNARLHSRDARARRFSRSPRAIVRRETPQPPQVP
jgi:hypothetical protein